MIIWVLAIIIYGLAAYTGKFQGGIRMIISFVGVFLGAVLAWPLAPAVRGVIALFGIQNPLMNFILPPIAVWLAFVALFIAIAFSVYYKIDIYYKYKTSEDTQAEFYKLNNRLGLCVAAMTASVYLVVAGMVIYIAGYLTTQIKSTKGDENPLSLRFMNQARMDLKSTGLEKICEAVNPVPSSYFDVADCLGLLVKNPDLRTRLQDYPPLISLSQVPEFKDMNTDTDFQALMNGGTLLQILQHPRAQAVLQNKAIMGRFQAMDYKDLLGFLRTGKSEKYASDPALGRWRIDLPDTLNTLRKKGSWGPAEYGYAKRALYKLLPNTSLIVGSDNTAYLLSSLVDLKLLPRIAAVKIPESMKTPPVIPTLPADATNGVVASGSWSKSGENYTLQLGELGDSPAEAKVNRLELMLLSSPLIFQKVEY